MTGTPLIEICADGIDAARKAALLGADRIELCSDLAIGGITPAFGEIWQAARLSVPVNVLVRPRGGDFVYSPSEIESMLEAVSLCASAGVNGVVIGALLPEGGIDLPLCRDLVAMARSAGLSVTFHRAIDESAGIFRALEDVAGLGVDRVLTSGGAPTAWEGRETLAEMVRRARGRLIVMPGSGITAGNAQALLEFTHASEIHGSSLELTRLSQAQARL